MKHSLQQCYGSIILLILPLLAIQVSAVSLQITWDDNANNENGFIIERSLFDDSNFSYLDSSARNSTSYTDTDVITGEIYCYRISAYNEAGIATSQPSCIDVTDNRDDEALASPPVNLISISHENITSDTVIDVAQKKFYSFTSDTEYNVDLSTDSVSDIVIDAQTGRPSYEYSDQFSIDEQDNHLPSGYLSLPFQTLNTVSFQLNGSSAVQRATLYIKAGNWSYEAASLQLILGEHIYTIVINKGFRWEYFTVDIEFTGMLPVTIKPRSDRPSYSAFAVSGIVFHNQSQLQRASIVALDNSASSLVDVSASKYVSSESLSINNDASKAQITYLDYMGRTSYREGRYHFSNYDETVANGHRVMTWHEENGVAITMQSEAATSSYATLYFTAAAWTDDTAEIRLKVNGEAHLFALKSGYAHQYYQVDIEFEGLLELELSPVGHIGGYSGLGFAGVSLH